MKFYLLVCFLLIVSTNAVMDLNLLKSYPDAVCLDGSAQGLYYSEGSGLGAENTIIYFQGGGFCAGKTDQQFLLSCLERSQTTLGSSLLWQNQYTGEGILSDDPTVNPHFYNWNKAFIPYCDGLLHTGYREDPIDVAGFKIHFQGYNSTVQSFSFLFREQGLASKQKVIISGGSAGGMATYIWTNFLRDILPQTTQLYSIPDSGFFIDYYGPGSDFEKAVIIAAKYGFTSPDIVEPKGCTFLNDPQNAFKCFLPQYSAHLIKTPLLIVNSQYDLWSLQNILGLKCGNAGSLTKCSQSEITIIQNFRDSMVGNVTDVIRGNPKRGTYFPACVIHVISSKAASFNSRSWTIPDQSANTLESVIYRFTNNQENLIFSDNVSWPYNTGCSGATINTERFLPIN